MKNLFAYGTLMCADIMREVSGIHSSPAPGVLNDYKRFAISGESYPALVPSKPAKTNGVVYRKIPSDSWQRLDSFEGEMYTRTTIEVILMSGSKIKAETYLLKTEFRDRLLHKEWDFEFFLAFKKREFVNSYNGFQMIFD